ncbi:MAG: hypothetical protein WB713_06920 [Methyloceanibacter sp.]
MQQEPCHATPWESIAILLALVLVVVLICMTLIVSGVMKLGFSLL